MQGEGAEPRPLLTRACMHVCEIACSDVWASLQKLSKAVCVLAALCSRPRCPAKFHKQLASSNYRQAAYTLSSTLAAPVVALHASGRKSRVAPVQDSPRQPWRCLQVAVVLSIRRSGCNCLLTRPTAMVTCTVCRQSPSPTSWVSLLLVSSSWV